MAENLLSFLFHSRVFQEERILTLAEGLQYKIKNAQLLDHVNSKSLFIC